MSNRRISVVDCASGHVACGVFSQGKEGGLTLEKFVLKPCVFDPADDTQSGPRMAAALREAVEQCGISKEALISVPGYQTLTKFIKVPSVDEARRAKIIQFEAQQNIPYPLDEVVWDYLTIADDQLETEVMLAAVKTDEMESLCEAVRQTGTVPLSVLPSALALYQSFRHNYPEVSETALVVNIGARSTNLLFVENGRFFVRTISLSGSNITESVAAEVKHDFEQAETLKISVLSGRSELSESSPARTAVLNAAQSFLGRLHLEITRSIVNYRRQSATGQPTAVYLTGGGSLLPDIENALSEKLKLPVSRFDTFKNVGIAEEASNARQVAAVLADMVGLAAQKCAPAGKRLSLLPPALANAMRFARQQPFLLAAAVVLVAALALPIAHFLQKSAAIDAESELVSQEIAPLMALKRANDRNLRERLTKRKNP